MGFNVLPSHPSDRLPRVPKGYYRHYKGGHYKVLYMSRHSETLEWMVVYRSLNRGTIWARPLEEWHKSLGTYGLNTFEKGPRFERVSWWRGVWWDLAYFFLVKWITG